MPVMQIRIVRMRVPHRLVAMGMRVWFVAIPVEIVFMLVMIIVGVRVFVIKRFVLVFVLMVLADVQPDADAHQCARDPEHRPGRFL